MYDGVRLKLCIAEGYLDGVTVLPYYEVAEKKGICLFIGMNPAVTTDRFIPIFFKIPPRWQCRYAKNNKKSPLLSKDFLVEVRGIEPLTF